MTQPIDLDAAEPIVRRGGLEVRHRMRFPGDGGATEWTTTVDRGDLCVIDRSVVPAIPASYVLACRLGHDLRTTEALPPALHEGARRVGALLSEWYGWRPAELLAPLGAAPLRPQRLRARRHRGLFFTRGVDSWGTYLDLVAGPWRQRPTHLITVDNEVHLPEARRAAAVDATAAVAQELGLPLVVVRTDVRAVIDPLTDWGTETHGSVLAGIALLLRGGLDRATIAPTHWTPLLRPWGSHPDLDPAWSVPELEVVHHPGGRARWERVAQVVQDPLASATLQVCWQGVSDRNCGRCEKCLRLLTSLELLGARERLRDRFDHDLDLDAIDAIPSVSPHPWCDTIDHCDRVGLAADPLRQRWEDVDRVGRPPMEFQTRPIQPRLGLALDPARSGGTSHTELARALASAGLRLDHRGDPRPIPTITIEQRDGRAMLLADDQAIALADLRPGALDAWLARHGIDPTAAIPFDPDGQAAPEAGPDDRSQR